MLRPTRLAAALLALSFGPFGAYAGSPDTAPPEASPAPPVVTVAPPVLKDTPPLLKDTPGVTFKGTLAVAATDLAAGTGLGFADLTLAGRIMPDGRLGLEIGTYLFALDGKRPHETYAALTWQTATPGRMLKFGAIRPAYDAVLPSVFARTAPYLAYTRAEVTRSHNTVEAMRRTAVPWGLSVEGARGGLTWAASAHHADKGGFRSASVALSYQGDGWQVAAAVEDLISRDDSHEGVNAKIGGRVALNRAAKPATLGLAYHHPEGNDRSDTLSVDLQMPLSSRFDLSVMGEFTEDARDDAYGLSATYHIGTRHDLSITATDGAAGDALHMTFAARF